MMAKDIVDRRDRIWLLLLLFLALGLSAWIYELANGLATTGMRGVISWGLYICTFVFFVKLSAGGLIVASSAEVFEIDALRPLARLGALTAAVCILLAGLTLIPDLGRPERIANLLLHPNVRSPMIWDAVIVTLYLVLAVFEVRLMSNPTETNRRRLRILAFVGLPAAFALHSITAWIFGLQISHTFWNTALMAPLFVVSAILSGTALIAIIVGLMQTFGKLNVEAATWRKLGGLIAISLALDLFFMFSEYLTVLWAGVPNEVATLRMALPGGEVSLVFWLEWIIGGIIPFILLISRRTRSNIRAIVTSAALVLIGVYSFQIVLIPVGMANPLIQLAPGNSLGTYAPGVSVFQYRGHYAPTWVEYFIILGLVALGALLLMIGWKYVPSQSSRELERGA
ncbi:MAG: NrfD/PsrC family molybdoenzyme membrane anchor subunit [Acidobacteriaceae bacterium]